ncbi:tol-pal system-associated acyl-CoA thioesterase [Chromohalobacter sp. HP20-39]|uniref:tol-pal system-associated acyl-CoA thioesterase n=1 Tax=Chromohalobacter sp. HP20-39 TaxID=3079306 RepID=UPI00294B428F|nr:tol-pal system-associated acyl-CoA thioesterase [Chromohalobacter sp. HP20-39]MDV6320568.1 tol-pal system-associated acyl-CoA thioesterase [Chromohalobacter sp. HP20-39]
MSGFTHAVKVYIEDTDAGGIVYYVNYLKYMERARSEWLNHYGLTQRDLLAQGIQLVVHQLECRYAKPAHLDDELHITADVVESTACRATFAQTVTRRGERLCEARVDIVCLEASRLKPVRWPDALHPLMHG